MGESFTIQISSNLLKKLAEDGNEKFKKKPKKPKAKTPRDPQSLHPKPQQKRISDDSHTHTHTAAAGWPLKPPHFAHALPPAQPANAELDAVRSVLQESEGIVERLQKQEEEMSREVTRRAKDLRDKEFKLPRNKPMRCLAESDACFDCYKAHAADPLKCADAVRNFADCARKFRQQLDSQGN